MKHKKIILLAITTTIVGVYACNKNFLDVSPVGVLDEATLSSPKGVDRLLISAYAMLDGHDGSLGLGGEWGSSGSNFLYGGIGGGEANGLRRAALRPIAERRRRWGRAGS